MLLKIRPVLKVLLAFALTTGWLQAAPYFGETFTYQQPDGESFQVRLYGDEFFAYQETEDGYLIIRDPKSGFFCYAKVTPEGSKLISTGVRVGRAKPAGLKLKQRLERGLTMSASLANRNLLEKDEKGRRNTGKKLVQEPSGEIRNVSPDGVSEGSGVPIAPAPPPAPTLNKRVGLVLLASFPDRPGDITKTVADIDNYCNAETYTAGGNATSIYGYFQIQSNGKLDYKNNVTAWFTAANPRSYYTDNTVGYGTRARDLIREGLAVLKTQGFDFTKCDGNGDGKLDGVNIFYAGARVNAWSEGLWPHQSSSSWTGLTGTGLTSTSYDYQITDMPSSLTIGTFCHENGHMICDFPDLYSYDGNAANLGTFSLMHSSGSTHPRHVDPYLKIHAGWADVVDLTSTSNLQCSVQQDRNFFYRYRNPVKSTEYFLFETRGTAGYEGAWGGAGATNPANGLVIYHASQTGSNTSSSIFTRANPPTTTLSYVEPYELMVVEATPGTLANGDPWYTDPNPTSNDSFSSAGVSSISDVTIPDLKFWAADGRTTASGANINTISAAGATMTFKAGSASLPVTPVTNATTAQLIPKADYAQNAASQTFAVFNSAGGTLSYSITDDASWLSCSPASGSVTTSASVITVAYTTSALAAGTHSATITIDGGSGGIKTIPVTLTVNAQPTLASFPSSISKSGNAGSSSNIATFYVRNSGGGTAAYSITKTQSWLSLDRTSGTVASEQDLITATLNATGLSPGVYTDTITVTSSAATNSPLTISVTFTVLSTDMIVTSPNGGEQWGKEETKTITWISSLGGNVKIELFKGGAFNSTIIANTTNDGAFDWPISGALAGASDYTVKISSIETPAKTDTSNASFSILPTLAEALDTSGLTWATSGNANWFAQSATTKDGIDAAQGGDIADSQSTSMETTLTGPGVLTFWWKVSSEPGFDYLQLYLNNVEQTGSLAKIAGEVDWIQKTVTIPAGSQTIKWTYSKDSSVDTGSDTAWVDQVVYTPSTAPEIAVEQPVATGLTDGTASINCGTVNLGSSSAPVTFTVRNTGTADLTGLSLSKTGTHNADYALGSLGATTLAPGASTTFTVTFTPGAAGARTAAIQIASNDADENPFDISLAGTGVGPGTLAVGPAGNLTSSGNYGGPFSPSSLIYTLSNPGNSPIDWTATKTAAWVTVSSSGGTLAAGANTTVTVSLDANALAVGGYNDTVSFTNTTNGSGNTTRSVALTVNPSPVTVNLSDLLQTYDGSPKPVTVTTTPGGKAYSVAYTPSGVPVNAGSYPVTVTITEPNHSGSASGSLTIQKAAQTISFAALDPVLDNAAPFALTATASSGLSVSYGSSNPLVATVSGNTVTIVGLGTSTITASQAGDTNYNAATAVPQTLTVVRSNPLAVTGGPYKVLVGQALSLNGSASLPAYSQTITTYEWDLNNDGNFTDATGATPAAIPFATLTDTWGMVQGLNTIQLRVTDSANNTSTVSTTVELVLSLTWDANGTTAGQTNGAGAWLGTNLWWDGAANQTWASGSNATFGGPNTAGGAVTLASPTSVNAITFNQFTGTYTLGTAAQTLTISGGINKTSTSAAVTFSSPLNLGADQTWTNNSIGILTTGSGTNLVTNNNYQLTIDGTGNTTLGVINSTAVTIAGSGALVKNGPSLLSIGGANSGFTGPVFINGGVLRMTNDTGGLGSGNITLNGGVLDVYWGLTINRTLGDAPGQIQIIGGASGFSQNGGGQATNVTFNNDANYEAVWGSSFFNPSTLVLTADVAQGTANTTFNNKLNLNGATRTIQVSGGTTGAASATISGIIRTSTGTAGLIKTGNGLLILSAANSYNGDTTISAGTLQIGNNNAGSLGNGTYNSNISISGGSNLRIFSTANQILGGVISGGGGLVKAYAGTLTLANSNTYTGKTSIIPQTAAGAGTVIVTSFNSVIDGTASSSLGAPTNVPNGTIDFGSTTSQGGATLRYTGPGETTDRVINFLFNGTGATKVLDTSGGGLLKFTEPFTGSGSVNNDITLQGSSNGEITGGLPFAFRNLAKSGNNTWTLGGSVGNTGATTVSAGRLALGANNVLSNTAAVSIASATLDAATFSDTLGTLDVTSASVINLGSGAALAFADSSAIDWAGGTLNLTGTFVPGTSLRFGTTSTGLTSTQLAKISAAGFGPFFLNADGYLTVDNIPPTLAGNNFVDGNGGGPILINNLVNYTITFSEDMNAATISAADFGNAGTAAVTIGTVVETTPGVFTVPVTPTSSGSLQLRVNQNAVLKDVAGNDLNTASAIPDDTILTVDPAPQTITFAALPPKVFGDAPLSLTATASSGLAVSYVSSNTAVATISSSTVTIVGAGSTTITASQAGDTNYAAAASVPQTLTVDPSSQTITFAALPAKAFGDAPISLAATASSGLAVSYSSSNTAVATISGSTVTIVGAGSTTITASQAGDTNYTAAASVPQTLTVTPGPQTITFAALPAKTFGDAPISLTATASSGLAVSYASSNEAVATVSGSTVTIVGAGSTTITASQAGDTNYVAAASVPQTLTVAPASQTITFAALPAKTFGDAPFALTGSASSGLAVSYASSDEAVATVSGSTVTIVGAGSTTITSSQAGNTNYAAAASVPQTLTVAPASQTITFAALAAKTFGDAPFALTGSASSGLAVSYASSDEAVATVSGSTITIVGAGSTTITASQAGNTNYAAAASVPQTLTVAPASQTITFAALAAKTFGDAPFALTGSASSGLAVSYASSDEAVATVSGSTVTIVGAGSTTITASQAGNTNYAAAASVPQTLTVAPASQTITFAALAAKTFGDAPFALTGSASSGLAVSYASSDEAVATVSGSTITIVGAGSTTITASQAGNANYAAAPSVPQTLAIAQASQTITFGALPAKTFGDAPFSLTGSASSGLAVSYTSSNTAIATVSGSTVTIVGAGSTTITASQAGDTNYAAAVSVPQTLTVADTAPTVASITDDKSGAPITVSTLVTYTVTFSEDMDASTVTAADFGNAGTAAVTIGSVIETSPGVFTVQATPTSAGTLQLKVNADAVLKDVAGNNLDTTVAIADNAIITVQTLYAAWAGGAAFDADANGDGVANGLAWVLGAANPSANASGLLPVPTNEGGKLVMAFRCLKTINRGTAVLKVQFTSDLGLTDPWTNQEAVVPDGNGTVGTVVFETAPDANPAFIQVRATSPLGKRFGRLQVTEQ